MDLTLDFNSFFPTVNSAAKTIKKHKNNPDFLGKTCQLAFSILVVANARFKTCILPRFTAACLHTYSMHNFLGFLKLPYDWLYPINANSIDINKLTVNLFDFVSHERGDAKEGGDVKESARRARGEQGERQLSDAAYMPEELRGFIRRMAEGGIAYRTVEEFKDALQASWDKFKDLRKLEVPLKPKTLLGGISAVSFALVDLACIPLYLNAWGINISPANLISKAGTSLGFSKVEQSLGQYRLFQYGYHHFDDTVWFSCCVGFGAQVLEALQSLYEKKYASRYKGEEQFNKICAIWDIVVSGSEFAFSLASLMKMERVNLAILCAVTKTIGLISIIYKPKPLL